MLLLLFWVALMEEFISNITACYMNRLIFPHSEICVTDVNVWKCNHIVSEKVEHSRLNFFASNRKTLTISCRFCRWMWKGWRSILSIKLRIYEHDDGFFVRHNIGKEWFHGLMKNTFTEIYFSNKMVGILRNSLPLSLSICDD